jgi:hypothetical protein
MGPELEILSVISLHRGLPGAWPIPLIFAKIAVDALVEHWQACGLPTYAHSTTTPSSKAGITRGTLSAA